MKELLKKRNIAKSKKPKFLRKDSNKYAFGNKWRKPRGLHNKKRLKKKGHQKNPSVGYGSPKAVKYLTKEGLNRVKICNLNDLEKVNKEQDIIVLSSKLGLKKKLEILQKSFDLGIKVENVKSIKEYIEDKKQELEDKKKLKKKKIQEKEKSKKESLKKAEKRKEKPEDKEDKEKEIKEEVLKSKQEIKIPKDINVKQDSSKSKAGHMASSIPGTRQ